VAGVAVTEVVEPDAGDARPAHQRLEIPPDQVTDVKWLSVELGKDQSMIVVIWPQKQTLLILAGLVPSKIFQ
jgi:hypothetical protein